MTAVSTTTPPTPSAGTGRNGLIHAVGRLGWGVADQGISSLSNFALGIFVARTFGASNFGAFALAFLTYSVVINAARGLATDPLLVRYSGDQDLRWRQAASSATGTALAVGLASGALCVVTGLLLPEPLGATFVALGIGLPGLALQDSWRFTFYSCSRGASAFVNDLFWTVLLVATLVLLDYEGAGSEVRCMLAFGATATVAAVLGALQARVLPRPGRAATWLRTQSDLSVRYLLENVSMSGALQLRSFLLGAVAGLAAVGYVRASEILMGPFSVVLMGISGVAVPEASRVFHRDAERLRRFCLVLGGAQATAAVVWGVIVLTVFPFGVGPALLKDLWIPTVRLVPAFTMALVAASFITAATAGLRAMGVARRSLRAQLIGATLCLIGGTVGAILGGALGTSWGFTAGLCIAALVWWHQLRSALNHHSSTEEA